MVPWIGLQCVIVVYSDHAYFFCFQENAKIYHFIYFHGVGYQIHF